MSPVFSSLHRQSSQEIIRSLVLLWVKLITFFASIPLDYSLLCGGYFYLSLFFFSVSLSSIQTNIAKFIWKNNLSALISFAPKEQNQCSVFISFMLLLDFLNIASVT